MDKIKIGIAGYGNMGRIHARNITGGAVPAGVLTAIADIDPQRIGAAQSQYKDAVLYFDTTEEMIDSGALDVIIIATPHYSHPHLSIAALNRGINVICEKPSGVYTKQVREMNDAANRSKSLFTVMFNQRTNCIYRKMREIILSGGIGEIKRINWLITNWYRSQSYYDSSSWRATWSGEGGGVLTNQCPHQLDLLQWVTDMMPKKVHAFCHFGKWHDIEVEDDVTAYLEYENGATGAFITSTADCPGTNRLEIMGTLGKLVCENEELIMYTLEKDEREFNRTYTGGFGEPKHTVQKVQTDGQNTQHVGIINNFINTLLGKEELFVNGQEGIKGVELMNAMLLSTWLNKAVTLPIDEELFYSQLKKRIDISRPKADKSAAVLDVSGTYSGNK